MTRWSLLGLAGFLAAPLVAQNPALPRHVVYGVVFDSVTQAPLAGAVVQIASRDATGPLHSATTDSTGHFRLADLPSGQFLIGFCHDALTALGLDAPLTLRVTAPGHRALVGEFAVPVAGVARRDVRLADSSVVRGPSSLRGRVVHENGEAVTSARAVIAALARDVPVQNGTFFLTEPPLGTWVVEARAIGLEPRSVLFEAAERETTETTITMSDRAQPLDAVPVRDVLAVEAYPDVAFAPPQRRSNVGATISRDGTATQVCAVVVAWTSR